MLSVSALSINSSRTDRLISNLHFCLKPGHLLHIRGENGVGKTTLLATLAGYRKPKSGLLKNSFNPIAYLPQQQNRVCHLPFTLNEVLNLSGSHKASILLENCDLSRAWNTASGGEKQRVLLACILQLHSELIILDEPFNHLDQKAVTDTRSVLCERVRNGAACILVSHNDEVSRWASNLPHSQITLEKIYD